MQTFKVQRIAVHPRLTAHYIAAAYQQKGGENCRQGPLQQ